MDQGCMIFPAEQEQTAVQPRHIRSTPNIILWRILPVILYLRPTRKQGHRQHYRYRLDPASLHHMHLLHVVRSLIFSNYQIPKQKTVRVQPSIVENIQIILTR